ncbi:hypothetical protein BGZ75_008498, partial [Mortierella antarctica]
MRFRIILQLTEREWKYLVFQQHTTTQTCSIAFAKIEKSSWFGSAGAFDPHRNIQDQTGLAKPIWSVEYYSKFFDVDTAQVMERCFASVIPKGNFLDIMGGSPDLY